MKLQTAERKRAKIKMALQGPSGSGKTKSALLLAHGLCNDWEKIAVIDTENHSSELFSHLGKFKVTDLSVPFSPERYIDAINLCVESGIQVIIIDSLSHEWEGLGGILDQHSQLMGNSYTNWSKLTPRHNAFIQMVLQCPVHVIATIRSKQDYILIEKNGKQVPEKVGMKGVQRDGVEYDFTLVFDLDMKHFATASKDRTELFSDQPEFRIDISTGQRILDWCNQGTDPSEDICRRIGECKSIGELLQLHQANPSFQHRLAQEFTKRKLELSSNQSKNGTTSSSKNKSSWN